MRDIQPKPKRTKIVATLGPATNQPGVLEHMIAAGVDVIRLNFSHGTRETHERNIQTVRQQAKLAGRAIGIIADLQGPKIRIKGFSGHSVVLTAGNTFILDTALGANAGDVTK